MFRTTLRRALLLAGLMLPLFLVSISIGGRGASAGAPSATYQYLIATGPVCDLVACPEMSSAPNGDVLSVTGAGTFTTHPNSASGGGTFVHADASGNVLGSGTWGATDLVSFVGFGIAPDLVPILPAGSTGGRAVLQVHLTPDGGGAGFDALMTVICDLGSNPAGQSEVVRLAVPGVINFNKHVDGGNIFIQQ